MSKLYILIWVFRIVKFYAPWCPHCKRLAPFWASLSIEFEKDGAKNDFHFGEVNCDIEEGLLKRFNVQGYPTILLFHNGKKVDEYEGATNSDKELRPYINDQLKKYKPVPVKVRPAVTAPLTLKRMSLKLSICPNWVKKKGIDFLSPCIPVPSSPSSQSTGSKRPIQIFDLNLIALSNLQPMIVPSVLRWSPYGTSLLTKTRISTWLMWTAWLNKNFVKAMPFKTPPLSNCSTTEKSPTHTPTTEKEL